MRYFKSPQSAGSVAATVAIVILLASSPALSQFGAPNVIGYQGVLSDSLGNPAPDGFYDLTFKLYTAAVGGSPIWTEAHTGPDDVQVTNGQFDVTLGSINSLGGIPFSKQFFLGLSVESDPEMMPRTPMNSAPYALAMRYMAANAGVVTVMADLGIGMSPDRQLTVADTNSAIMNIKAANRELLVGVNQSTGALIRGTTNNNLNLGANGSDHMTVRSDGDIHVHENLLIGTTARRGMLTVRGPNDVENGPVLYMFGDGSDQTESGRIRFVEGTSSTNWRGAFMHYDGSANALHIGTHNTSDKTPGNDLNAISIGRSSRDVTVSEDLLVDGDYRKDYGGGSYGFPAPVAMGVVDASAVNFDWETANVEGLVKNTGVSGWWEIYIDAGCGSSTSNAPYAAVITMKDTGVDDISAKAKCESITGLCTGNCLTIDVKTNAVLGFVDDKDFQFVVYKVE